MLFNMMNGGGGGGGGGFRFAGHEQSSSMLYGRSRHVEKAIGCLPEMSTNMMQETETCSAGQRMSWWTVW